MNRTALVGAFVASIASFSGAATPLGAQARASGGKPCLVAFTGVTRGGRHTQFNRFTDAAGRHIMYVSGGVDARCEGQGNRLLADSAEHHESRGELILIDRVRYTEPQMSLSSDRMVYYTNDERLFATGNVQGLSANGTRFSGPQLDYYRAKPGLRDVPVWRAPGRPRVRMAPTDSASRARVVDRPASERGDSTDLTADFIHSENDSLVWAVGKVVIERDDMRATSDSASLDRGREFARLMREPVIVGTGERPFTLVGTRIDLWSKEQQLERVVAAGNGRVVSDSVTLVADTLDMRLAAQRMERVFAWGGRARAISESQEMEADSLDVRMPGQRLAQVNALGKAIAYSTVDTTRIESADRDWIAGDTLVARFDTTTAADTTEGTRMRDVVATGSARAFYQLAPAGGAKGLPNISYNRGRAITVTFDEGEVASVDVSEKASGMFLEPIVKRDTTSRRDTTSATTAPPATAGVQPPRRP